MGIWRDLVMGIWIPPRHLNLDISGGIYFPSKIKQKVCMPHDAWPILAPICIIHFYYNFIVHAHKKRTIEKMIVPWIYLMRHKMIKAYNENNIGKCCHKIILQTFMEAILKSLIYCPNNLIRITSSTSWRMLKSMAYENGIS